MNNHRQFLLFVASLVTAIICFIRLAVACEPPLPCAFYPTSTNFCCVDFSTNAPELPDDASCVLPTGLCAASHFDTFALATVFWAALQLSWTLILLGAQLWQICRQMTTLEVSNVGRYGFMGGKPGVSAAGQQGFVEKYGAGAEGHVHGPSCDHGRTGASKKKGKGAFLLKILGIDRFTEGKAAEGLAKAGTVTNPFDLGIWRNCTDFWSRGRELGVDYTRLYDVPDGGVSRFPRLLLFLGTVADTFSLFS